MGNSLQTNETLHDLRPLADPAEQHRLQSDQELLQLYLAVGDRCALEALIERYTPLVASVCSLTVADRNCAEDAFQATSVVPRLCPIPKSRYLSVEKQACLQQVV